MQETVESIRNYGVLMPGIARPRAEGGYEIIAGHRRRHACEAVGLETMPMFIRNYTDDEATIIMVDSNIQREDILPSEKAKAYAMKYEAMKHQGRKGNGNTLDEVGEAAGESRQCGNHAVWYGGTGIFDHGRVVLAAVRTPPAPAVSHPEAGNPKPHRDVLAGAGAGCSRAGGIYGVPGSAWGEWVRASFVESFA